MYEKYNSGDGNRKSRFLVITGLCGIGDALFVSPVVQTLHRMFPDSHITVLSRRFPWAEELFMNIPHVDGLFVYDYERKDSSHRGISGLIRLRKELKALDVDVAVVLHDTFRAAFVAYLSGAHTRVGYDTEHRRFLLTHYKKKNYRGYGVKGYLSLLELFGVQRENMLCELVWNSPEEVCRQLHYPEQPYVVLIPGSSWKLKQWPVESYIFIVRRLIENGVVTVIVGKGEGDAFIGKALAEYGAIDLVNRYDTLSETGCILSRASVVVGGDTGMIHLASALGVETIALWGPTSPVEMVVRMRNRKDFYLSYPCYRICRKTLAEQCPYEQECLRAIKPTWVYETVCRLLKNP